MAIRIRNSAESIFHAPAEALVNPVNCKGVSGRGLAYQFARRFPREQAEYVAACKAGEVVPGTVLVSSPAPATTAGLYPVRIIHFPTKDDWRNPSRLEWIEDGLRDLGAKLHAHQLRSVAIPGLDCGLGGLSWDRDVLPLVLDMATALYDTNFDIYPPRDA